MSGMTSTGIFTRRSLKIKPRCDGASWPRIVWSALCRDGSPADFASMYSVMAFIDGLSWRSTAFRCSSRKDERIMEDLVYVHVEHGEEGIWITFPAIGLHSGSNKGL